MVNAATDLGTAIGAPLSNIIFALIVFIVGRIVIGWILKLVQKIKFIEKLDPTAKTFIMSFVRIGLYVLLIISIIGILGVPMASIITVLASCGVAVGMAMQGALGNLAGGIMLMFFRPFNVGDYISAAGGSGFVREITLFYTRITTFDNVSITIPNGSLMNANVSNYSSEEFRRVDLTFGCGKGEDPARVQEVLLKACTETAGVLADGPEAPFARVSGGTNEAMEITVRGWCKGSDYWSVYFDLTQNCIAAMGAAGISAPAVRVAPVQPK